MRAERTRGGHGPAWFQCGGAGRAGHRGSVARAARRHQDPRDQVLPPAHRAQVRVGHPERGQHRGGQR